MGVRTIAAFGESSEVDSGRIDFFDEGLTDDVVIPIVGRRLSGSPPKDSPFTTSSIEVAPSTAPPLEATTLLPIESCCNGDKGKLTVQYSSSIVENGKLFFNLCFS